MSGTRFSAFCLKGAFFMPIKAKAFMYISKFSLRAGENGQGRKGRDTQEGVCGRAGGEERLTGILDDAKKEKYCQLRAGGKSQRQAYLEAFPNSRRWKPQTVDVRACELEKDGKVLVRLRALEEDNEKKAGLSRKNLLDKLEAIINTEDIIFRGNDVMRAIELYANLCGYNEQKNDNAQEKEAQQELLDAIRGIEHRCG